MAETTEKPKPKLILEPARLKYAEHEYVIWTAQVEPGVTKEDVLDPAYWSHVGRQFKPLSKVILVTDDNSIYAELLIVACANLWAKVHVLCWHNLQTKDVAESQAAMVEVSQAFKVEWKGPHHRFAVIRQSDHEMIHSGDQTKEAAITWLRDYERVTA